MSDVFNTSVNKQKIGFLLFDQEIGDPAVSAESLLHPAQPNATSNTRDSALERAEEVLKLGLNVFKPKLIQENLIFNYDEEELGIKGTFRDYIEALHEAYLERRRNPDPRMKPYIYADPGQLVLPAGDTFALPYYKPSYKNGKYDEKILNQVAFEVLYNNIGEHKVKDDFTLVRTREVDKVYAKHTLKEVRAAAHDYILSSGTFKGQLSRLRAMQDIRYGLKGSYKPRTLQELGLDFEDFATILQETLPIKPVDDVIPLMYLPSSYFTKDEENVIDDNLPALKVASKAGPPFPSRLRKGDVYTSIVYLADHIMRRVGAETRKGVGQANYSRIISEEPWIAMAYLFPKEERYKRNELHTKTRNIFSACSITHLLMSMASDPIMSKSNYNLASDGSTTPSLQKFTPYFQNIDTFIDKMLDENGTTDAIYADNWYVSWLHKNGTKSYYSLDLVKGEAQATPDIASAISYYLLTRGWITEDNYVAFNKTWAAYLLKVVPACVVDSIAVWYNMQLRFPGQGSGNTFTFLINQAVTTKFRYFWAEAGKPCPSLDGKSFTPEFEAIMKKTGVNWKIELFHQDFGAHVQEVVMETPTTGFLQDDTPHSLDDYGQSSYTRPLPRIRLDILGFDGIYSNKLGRVIPVLAWERFLPSLMWPRKTQVDLKRDDVHRMYRLLRYEVLRVMGGFTDPVIDQALGSIVGELRKHFENHGVGHSLSNEEFMQYDDLAPALQEVFESMSSQVQLDQGFMLSFRLIEEMTSDVRTQNKMAKDPTPAHLKSRTTQVYQPRGKTSRIPSRYNSFKRDLDHIMTMYRQDRDRRQVPDITQPDLLRGYAKRLTDSYLKNRKGALAILDALGDFDKIVDHAVELIQHNTTVDEEVKVRQELHLSLNRVLDATIRAVKDAEKAVNALVMQDPVATIHSEYTNSPTSIANPTLGHPATSPGLARTPTQREGTLTKSQKKNLKNRARERERKALLARINEN